MIHIFNKVEKLTNVQITGLMLGFSFVLVIIGAFVWSGNKSYTDSVNGPKVFVATTIFPLADIVQNVGGSSVEVLQLLPSGASPHAYDLTPSQVAKLSKAEVLFYIGYGLDNWAVEFAEANGIRTVRVDEGITLMESTDEHEHGEADDSHDDEEEHHVDPHYWLSLPNGMLISKNVKDTLVEIHPELSSEFEANQNTYAAQLGKTDIELRQRLYQLQGRNFAAFHGAWKYFARGYGINFVAEFEEFPGTSPSPEYVAEFQRTIQQNQVNTIFIEPQFSSDVIAPLAGDLGAKLMQLDPLGGVEGRSTYQEMMRFNITQVIESQ